MQNPTTKREGFTGKLGFVFAAAGSAVGLGNIWRFPYLAAKYGGGIFLLVYLALSLTFGFSLMVAEIAIGRKTGRSPLGAFGQLDRRFTFVGIIASLVPFIILPYYSVIGGWVMKYFFGFVSGEALTMANADYFGNYIATTGEPILWFALFLALCAVIVLFGVQKGIEKVSKFMMPLLVVTMLFIVIYSTCTLEGAWQGVLYYITPDFRKFSLMTVVAAMGQLFYSMSLAMGVMITFGSYMKKETNIEEATHHVEIFDTGIAFLSGLMIVPAFYAVHGGSTEAMHAGPGLMFTTLPQIFATMPGGGVIGAIFFFMVLLAALTSAISLTEAVVATLLERLPISRRLCCLLVAALCLLLGLPSTLGYSAWASVSILGKPLLDFFDFLGNNIVMPLVALATAIFVGWFLGSQVIIDEASLSGNFKAKRLFSVTIRYIAPLFLVVILISSTLDAFGIIKI